MQTNDTTLQRLLEDAAVRQPELYAELLLRTCERLRRLARKRLRGFSALRRWVETDDVMQQAMIRLHRCLNEVKPVTVADFIRLAACQIRRELHDLHRHHFGPLGHAANHDTDRGENADAPDRLVYHAANDRAMPVGWDQFDELIDQLPTEEREVVDALFVHDLTQEEAAKVLNVSLRTVKRRWQSARLRLQTTIERAGGNYER